MAEMNLVGMRVSQTAEFGRAEIQSCLLTVLSLRAVIW